MTKWTPNGRKWSCKTSCLACTFLVFVNFCLTKKEKRKKKKIVAIRESFFPSKWSVFWFSRKFFTRNSSQKLPFAKVFVKNFAIFWSCESFCSRKFLPLKYFVLIFFKDIFTPLFHLLRLHVRHQVFSYFF